MHVVFVKEAAAYARLIGDPTLAESAGAYSTGQQTIFVRMQAQNEASFAVLRHEITHALVHESIGNLPTSINLDSFLRMIVSELGRMMEVDRCDIIRLTPEGDLRILLDEGDPAKVDALERQFLRNNVTEDVLFATGQGVAPWMASITFGGPDLQTAYIGSLKGKQIPYFRAPAPGLPMVHWNDSLC